MLSHAVSEFQSLGTLPGGTAFAWNVGDGSGLFWSIIDGSLGITSSMTWLQLAIWAIYIATVASLYRRPVKISAPVELTPAR